MSEANELNHTNEEQEREPIELQMGPGESEAAEQGEDGRIDINVLVSKIKEGDILAFQDGSIAATVLSVSANTTAGRFYTVRVFGIVSEPITASQEELANYILQNDLQKLLSRSDQMEAVDEVLLLNEGDVYTKNGEMFMEIVSGELTYIDTLGSAKSVVGVRTKDDVVAFRDSLWVKSAIFGNTDQFPPQS